MKATPTRIRIKTLTPLWTGGVMGTTDQLHETGIIGSLRWWYETIVRGLGGHACDSTSDDGCELSGREENNTERLGRMCAACHLFGCGGWRRRFRLDVEQPIQKQRVPIHFRTTIGSHRNWIGRIFHGRRTQRGNYDLEQVNVYYWHGFADALSITPIGDDGGYVLSQVEGLISFISEFGFLCAKPQYGFGQISVDGLSSKWRESFVQLNDRLNTGTFNREIEKSRGLSSLNQAIFLTYSILAEDLGEILKEQYHYGDESRKQERAYIPCAFDLRYKGEGVFSQGFRVWLERRLFGDNPTREERKKLDPLMGAVDRKGYRLTDKERQSSQIIFGMPVRTEYQDDTYSLRVVGFLPSGFPYFDDLTDLGKRLSEYVLAVFPHSKLSSCQFGKDITMRIKRGG